MIRILNAEPNNYSSQARILLCQFGELHEEACDRARLLELIPDYDVLIVRLGHRVDAELLDCAAQLRVVVTATTGLNHIDVEAARNRGIKVLSLKGERAFLDSVTATAELTWGLLLALMRRLPAAYNHVMAGGWDRDLFYGRQLKGKSLGILGFGRLGSIVADYGVAFRMRVLACDPFVTDIPDPVERVELAELLEHSDILTLHVNLNKTTHGLLGREAFRQIKHGAIFINTSRGELIDETAMLEALESGRLAGAALDVLKGEVAKTSKWPHNSIVWQYASNHNNLLLVPHIGGVTIESMEEAEIFMAHRLGRLLQEKI